MLATVTPVAPPDPSTYCAVMRRLDRDPRHAHQQRFNSYDVSLRAKVIEHPDGKVAMTLFFPVGKDSSVIRARRAGWIDVTKLWSPTEDAKASSPAPANPAVAPGAGSPLSESLRAMTWPALQELARERGSRQTGSRDAVEAGILASYQG